MKNDTEIKIVKRLGKLPPKDPFYQERENLHREVLDKITRTRQHIATLVGPKGIGKTAQALAYAYEQIENDERFNLQYKLIVWINYENFQEECEAIEKDLYLEDDLYTYLSNSEDKWLLIIDNATSDNFKDLPDTANGHIIITSREHSWINLIHVPHFTPNESLQLITRILNISLTTKLMTNYETLKQLIRIANVLDNYPHAIADAMKQLVKDNIILDAYYDDLIEQSTSFYPTEPKGLFYEEIKKILNHDLANDSFNYLLLLRLLAHIGPMAIPREFIHELIKKIDPMTQKTYTTQQFKELFEAIQKKDFEHVVSLIENFEFEVEAADEHDIIHSADEARFVSMLVAASNDHQLIKEVFDETQHQNIFSLIDKAKLKKQKSLQQKTNQVLLNLKQVGLIDRAPDNDELYIIAAPVLRILRYHFSNKEIDKYQADLLAIIGTLDAKLNEKVNYFTANKYIQYYRIHSKILIDRIIGMIKVDKKISSDLQKNSKEKEDEVDYTKRIIYIFQNCFHLRKIAPPETLLNILKFIVSLVYTLMPCDELDAASFYIQIVKSTLETDYNLDKKLFLGKVPGESEDLLRKPFFTEDLKDSVNEVPQSIAKSFEKHWQNHEELFYVYLQVLYLTGAILSRSVFSVNWEEIEKSFRLINISCYAAKVMIENSQSKSRKIEYLDFLLRLRDFWFYSYLKGLPYTKVQKAISDWKKTYEIGEEWNKVTYKGLLASLIESLESEYIFSSFRLLEESRILAFAEKHAEKLHYLPYRRYLMLKELKIPGKTKELLIRDIFDEYINESTFNESELYRILTYLESINIKEVVKDFSKSFFSLKNKLIGKYKGELSKILLDHELHKELQNIADRLNQFLSKYTLIPHASSSDRIYEVCPYEEAIKLLQEIQESLDKYGQLMLSDFFIGVNRKLAKCYLLRYEAYRDYVIVSNESKSIDKKQIKEFKKNRKNALQKTWIYFSAALERIQEHYGHDEPFLDIVIIFIGLLKLDLYFKQEKMSSPNYLDEDVRLDYFLRCRFIISQLFNNTHHYERELFAIWRELDPNYRDISATNKNIFDIKVSPSQTYYQKQLRRAEENLKGKPQDIWLKFARASALLNVGKCDKAVVEFTDFLRFFPYSAQALGRRALAKYKLEQYIEAFIDYEEAQKCHGNQDSLVEKSKIECEQAFNFKATGLEITIVENSKEGIFISTLKEEFGCLLENTIEKATGEDQRISSGELTARIIKAVAKLIPNSLQVMGSSINFPLGESIGDTTDGIKDYFDQEEKYQITKIKKITEKEKLIPEELNNSLVFDRVARQLVNMFQRYLYYLKYDGVIAFAKYLSHSMIDYLGSDRFIPYLTLEQQLIKGATQGYLKDKTVLPIDLEKKEQREEYEKDKAAQKEGYRYTVKNYNKKSKSVKHNLYTFFKKIPQEVEEIPGELQQVPAHIAEIVFDQPYWTPQGIVKRSNIRTPNKMLFWNLKHTDEYLERLGTEEEARARASNYLAP